jgi:hypothetical protein
MNIKLLNLVKRVTLPGDDPDCLLRSVDVQVFDENWQLPRIKLTTRYEYFGKTRAFEGTLPFRNPNFGWPLYPIAIRQAENAAEQLANYYRSCDVPVKVTHHPKLFSAGIRRF